jgi:hypothetical protein
MKTALLLFAASLAWGQVVIPPASSIILVGGTLPATCSLGQMYQKTGAGAGMYYCSAAPATWLQLAAGSGTDAVMGAATLLTPGALAYVTSAGVLGQDQTAGGQLFWDSVNHRLGIGTVAPLDTVHVNGPIRLSNSGDAIIYANGSSLNIFAQTSGRNLLFQANSGAFLINKYSNNQLLFSVSDSDGTAYLKGRVGIGTATPASMFDVTQPTAGVGTVSVSGTAVTGVGTTFSTTFKVGDTITVTTTSGSETKAIATITSDTVLVTAAFAGTAAAGTAYTLVGGARFNVLGNGFTGIGIAAPLYKLHAVDGANEFKFNAAGLLLFSAAAGSQSIGLQNSAGNASMSLDGSGNLGSYTSQGGLYFDNRGTGHIYFRTTSSPTSRLTLWNAGAVSIGASNTAAPLAPTTVSIADLTGSTGQSVGRFGSDGNSVSPTYNTWINYAGTAQSTNNLSEWRDAAKALIAYVGPTGTASFVSGGAVSSWTKYNITYANAAFLAASVTAAPIVVALPANASIDGLRIKTVTPFAGTAVSAVSCTLGDGTTADAYAPAYDVFAAASVTNFHIDGGAFSTTAATQNVTLTCTCNTAFGSGAATVLTAGSVDIAIRWSVIP